jgi:putative Mn2+ efflux pump MntP
LYLLPLGLDTLGVSISIGIKSHSSSLTTQNSAPLQWLRSALLFSLAEMLMPLLGLGIGYGASLAVSGIMHVVGPLILVAIGVWELIEEARERLTKRKSRGSSLQQVQRDEKDVHTETPIWVRQLLLALSISLDELAIGFSLGGTTIIGKNGLNPLVLCVFIGIQSFLITAIGITSGRALQMRLKPLQEWSELLSALVLIGLGIWLYFT